MSGKYNEKYVEEYNAAIAAYNRGDYEKAAEFMPKAAKEGDEYAQMVLGKMYYLGKGVERRQMVEEGGGRRQRKCR